MLKNHFKVALRGIFKNKAHSLINIAGLSVGMAVALLIGLWIWDEFSFDKTFQHYDRIAQVMQSETANGTTQTIEEMPLPMARELRSVYGSNFKYVVLSSGVRNHVLTLGGEKPGEEKFVKTGAFMEEDAPEMLTLKMLKGSRAGLKDPASILLSQTVSTAIFGHDDPLGKSLKIDNKMNVTITGVYEDLPYNNSFQAVSFIAPWNLFHSSEARVREAENDWGRSSWQVYVQLADKVDITSVSTQIKDVKLNKMDKNDAKFKPVLFLHPMSKWHLFSEFKNGINTGGRIQYVRLFGIIGIFVLLLACINFMNLSTARSGKRAKEVGIRKAIGSLRGQLIGQFYSESLLVVFLSFVFSLVLVWIMLPFFNEVADKKIFITWANPWFWLLSGSFILITGLIAGSYPALYLSSFQPIKVLKGTFRVGRFSSVPRKVLMVVQFTVSVILIIGTMVVFRQIQFAQSRPIGYDRDGLITVNMSSPDIHEHFNALRNDLLKTGAVLEIAESESPTTALWSGVGGLEWKEKDPNMADEFGNIGVSPEYGRTIGWQFVQGRDFSKSFGTDSNAMILNETAVKYMGLKKPIGETVRWWNRNLTVVGVIKDMVMESPFEPVKQTFFFLSPGPGYLLNIKLNPSAGTGDALKKVEAIWRQYAPTEPFRYKFADQQFAKKFAAEQRVGKLAGFFASLAIFISCLGLFGLASFIAEQRIKEIGVRKILGASVFSLWSLLSKDFVSLIIISLLIAMPAAYYFMHTWLENYTYRLVISGWIFVSAGLGTITITLLTVSFQSIKAALANPAKSLKVE
ncbi:ABC transporter permease [Flavitalea flava]